MEQSHFSGLVYNKLNMWFQGLLDCLCLRDWANRIFMGYNLVPVIPPEVIEWEILPRLPVKSLLRFKSVCKSWNLLITNPDFIRKHHHVRNLNEDALMILSRHINKPKNLLPKLTTIIGSIDGLVCFSSCYADDDNISKPIEFSIWNPATKHCLKIPPLPDESAATYFSDFVGFGYDSIANDFKVMYATRFEHAEQKPLLGFVYSCSSGCWRNIVPSNFLYNENLVKQYSRTATIINGSPYWWVELVQSVIIVWFDVQQEVYRLLDLGFIDHITGKAIEMMNLRDSLGVMLCDKSIKPSFFSEQVDIYVFSEECSIWNKKSIGPIMIKELSAPWRQYYMVGCFRNGEMLLVSNDLKSTCVNIENQTTNHLKSHGKEGYLCLSPCYDGCEYSESLVFIKGMESSNDKDDYQGIFCYKY